MRRRSSVPLAGLLLLLGAASFHDSARASPAASHAAVADSLGIGEGAGDSLRLRIEPVALAPAGRGGLLRADRLRHLSLAFALGLGAGLVSDSPAVAGAVPAGFGLLKEIDDGRRGPPGFDRWDLLADLIGAGLAAWAISALDR